MILLLLLLIFGCQRHIKPKEDSEITVSSVEVERTSPALREYRCAMDKATSSVNSFGPSFGPEVENALADYDPEASSKKLQVEYAKREAEREARYKEQDNEIPHYYREHISHEEYRRNKLEW